jgi:hypothetical protein
MYMCKGSDGDERLSHAQSSGFDRNRHREWVISGLGREVMEGQVINIIETSERYSCSYLLLTGYPNSVMGFLLIMHDEESSWEQ